MTEKTSKTRGYLLTAKTEVLYEKAFGILAKYANYLNNEKEPLDCISLLADKLAEYPPRIIDCPDEDAFNTLERNINEYKKIIDDVTSSAAAGA